MQWRSAQARPLKRSRDGGQARMCSLWMPSNTSGSVSLLTSTDAQRMRGFASCRAHGDPKRIRDANNGVYDAEHAN